MPWERQNGFDPKSLKGGLKMNRTKFAKILALLLSVCMCAALLGACQNGKKKDISENYRLSQKSITLNLSDEKIGSLTIVDDSYSEKKYTTAWKSSDAAVATVSNGVITAQGQGTAVITATVTVDGYDPFDLTCNVTVENTVINVESIYLTQSALTMDVGQTKVITAVISPSNATDKTVVWTSNDPSVAAVVGGQVSAIAPGTAVITATAGNASASCIVTVESPTDQFTKLSLSASTKTLEIGKTYTIRTTVTPDSEGANITWTSSNPSVAEVDSNGTVTAIKAGTATITATLHDKVKDKTATCKVTVKEPSTTPATVKATSIDLPSTYSIKKGEGTSWKLTATVKPSNTTDTVKWSSDSPEILKVDSKGNLTPVWDKVEGSKIVVITATAGSHSDSCVVTLVNKVDVPATSIVLNPDKQVSVSVGDRVTVSATLLPSNSTDSITWTTSDATVATVANGVITGVKAGTTIVTVKAGSITKQIVVLVSEKVKATVSLSDTALNLVIGDSTTLTKVVNPAAYATSLVWKYSSSNPAVATVNADSGLVVALAEGKAVITLIGADTNTGATVCSATCEVTVTATAQKKTVKVGILLSKTASRYDYYEDNNLTATLTFSPALTQSEISQLIFQINSSSTDVVYPDLPMRGEYTFNLDICSEFGSATLTPEVTGLDYITFEYTSTTINVLSPDSSISLPATSLNIYPSSSFTMITGEERVLGYRVNPAKSDDKIIFTSSDSTVAEVDPYTGIVTAVGAGTATITVSAAGKTSLRTVSASVRVTVTDPVTVRGDMIYVPVGTNYTVKFDSSLGTLINVTRVPSSADKGGISFSNTGVVTVSSSAVLGDTATFYLTFVDNTGKPVTKEYRIVAQRAATSRFNASSVRDVNVVVGDSGYFSDLGIVYDSRVDFSSSKSDVLYVSSIGSFEALKKGTAVVTVEYDGITYMRITVNVTEKASPVSVANITLELAQGSVALSSKWAAMKNYPTENRSFVSSNPSVVSVSPFTNGTTTDCLLTPKAAGTATITFQAGSQTVLLTIKVNNNSTVTSGYTLSVAGSVTPTSGADVILNLTTNTVGNVEFTISGNAANFFKIDTPNFSVNGAGTYPVTVSLKDGVDAAQAPSTFTVKCICGGVMKTCTVTFNR